MSRAGWIWQAAVTGEIVQVDCECA